MPDTPSPSPAPPSPVKTEERVVVVRPMPKIVFFYLTWIGSFVCAAISGLSDSPPAHLGAFWLGLLTLNLLVISFQFTETISIAVAFGVVAFVLAGLYFEFLNPILRFLGDRRIDMNTEFYVSVGAVFSVIYLIVWLRSRFDYWEFRHNEVLHRSGLFGEIKRYSTEDLRWFKEIPDVLERILLGSGRMVLTTPREPHPLVIEHVLFIERKDDRIAEMLAAKKVTLK